MEKYSVVSVTVEDALWMSVSKIVDQEKLAIINEGYKDIEFFTIYHKESEVNQEKEVVYQLIYDSYLDRTSKTTKSFWNDVKKLLPTPGTSGGCYRRNKEWNPST